MLGKLSSLSKILLLSIQIDTHPFCKAFLYKYPAIKPSLLVMTFPKGWYPSVPILFTKSSKIRFSFSMEKYTFCKTSGIGFSRHCSISHMNNIFIYIDCRINKIIYVVIFRITHNFFVLFASFKSFGSYNFLTTVNLSYISISSV